MGTTSIYEKYRFEPASAYTSIALVLFIKKLSSLLVFGVVSLVLIIASQAQAEMKTPFREVAFGGR
jgi:hypothetical protein